MKLAHPQDMSYTTCYSTAALLFHTIGQWKGKAKAQQVGKNGRGPWMHGSSEQQFCCAWSRVRGVWSVPELKDHSHTQLEWKSACSAYSVLHASGTSCAYATQKDNKCFGLFMSLLDKLGTEMSCDASVSFLGQQEKQGTENCWREHEHSLMSHSNFGLNVILKVESKDRNGFRLCQKGKMKLYTEALVLSELCLK